VPTLNIAANTYDQATSSKIIKEAEINYKKALKLKNAWRDTKKIIKKLKKHTIKKITKNQLFLQKKHSMKLIWLLSNTKNKKITIDF
jgi:hypothetical protein